VKGERETWDKLGQKSKKVQRELKKKYDYIKNYRSILYFFFVLLLFTVFTLCMLLLLVLLLLLLLLVLLLLSENLKEKRKTMYAAGKAKAVASLQNFSELKEFR